MGSKMIWKQSSGVITQVPLHQVITELAEKIQWPPEKVEQKLVYEKKLLQVPGAKYHIWRDSLH